MKHKNLVENIYDLEDSKEILNKKKSLVREVIYLSKIVEKQHQNPGFDKNITPCTKFSKLQNEFDDFINKLEEEKFGKFQRFNQVIQKKIHFNNILTEKKSKLGVVVEEEKNINDKLVNFIQQPFSSIVLDDKKTDELFDNIRKNLKN